MSESDLSEISEIELIYKSRIKPSLLPTVSSSEAAYRLFVRYWDENKIDFIEQAKVMLLNRSNRVLGIFELSSGGVSGTTIDTKIVFAAALKANASSIILAHNHPSGNLQPSQADLTMTRNIREAGQYLTITLHDHLIVTREAYYSMADENVL